MALKTIPCPICQTVARPAFNTPHAEVYGCTKQVCGHMFAGNQSKMCGVIGRRAEVERPEYVKRNHRLIDYFLQHGVISQGGQLLDLGSGEGHIAVCFKERGFNVFCVEPSEIARKVLEERGLDNCADSSDIPAEKQFDFVYAVEVIEHIPNPVETLKLVRSNLRPGGSIFITTPNSRGFKARVNKHRSEAFRAPHHLHFFTFRSLLLCLDKAGYTDVRQKYLNFMVPKRAAWRTAMAGMLHLVGLGGGIIILGKRPQ